MAKYSLQFVLALGLLVITLTVAGNNRKESRKEFIHKYKHIAIKEMERTGIPASIKLAQGILESGCGYSNLSTQANNHFGIKCHKTWDGQTFHQDDDEKDECFRKYRKAEDSWIDHSEFLTSRPRYASLFELSCTDYKAWAKGLKSAGYATNPAYADLLIKIIEEEKLYVYDKPGKHSLKKTAPREKIPDAVDTRLDNYRKREEIKNGIICIQSKAGDSYEKIAKYYNIKLKRLLQYNETDNSTIQPGQYVYLKRKRTRAAKGYDFHRVKEGDTMYGISQYYGVRLKNLKKFNYLNENEKLLEGEKIYLRSRSGI